MKAKEMEKTMEERIRNIIEEVLTKSKITLDEIILFGSRARGDFNEESDFDILIIIRNNVKINQKRKIWQDIFNALHKHFPFTPFDVIIKTLNDFESEKNVVNTISNEAYIEGEIIFYKTERYYGI